MKPISYFYMHVKNIQLEKLFILIFISFGAMFVFITPPGWNIDEPDHTYRVYQLATGNLLSEKVEIPDGLKAFGGKVPSELIHLYDKTGVRAPGAVTDTTTKVDGLYGKEPDIRTLKDDGSRTIINFSGAALYSPIAYAMYIPVFWLGELLSLPFFQIIILSRLIGLLFTAVAFFVAIKYIPVGKWIIFAIGLLPVVVVQAASISADVPQIAVSVLFITLIAKIIYAKRSPKLIEYGMLTALGSVLVLIKLVYAPLVLLVLAIPLIKKECRNRKHILFALLTVIIAAVFGIIWTAMVGYIDINSNPQANFELQKAYVLHEPIVYLKTLYYTFFTNQQPLALGNIFGNFVWASAPLAPVYAYIASAILFASVVVKSGRETSIRLGKDKIRIWRASLAVVSLMTAVLIATALYVYSTTLHQSSIVGLQSRYFIPVLPAILLLFYGNVVKNQRMVKIGIVSMSVFVLIGSILTVYHRLYQVLPVILQ